MVLGSVKLGGTMIIIFYLLIFAVDMLLLAIAGVITFLGWKAVNLLGIEKTL